MIILDAVFDYVLMIDAYAQTKTSKKSELLKTVYDPGAGTTTISRRFALDAGYRLKKNNELVYGVGGGVHTELLLQTRAIISFA